MNKEFLENLKVGDKVGVSDRHHDNLDTVKKITKTMIILNRFGRFNRKSGIKVGNDIWHSAGLEEPTEEFLKTYNYIKNKNLFKRFVDDGIVNKLNSEELKNMIEIFKIVKDR